MTSCWNDISSSTSHGEATASLASLFADIATRAARDLGYRVIDELTVSDAASGRVVVRPLDPAATVRLIGP